MNCRRSGSSLKSDKAQKDLYFKKRIEAIRNQIITLKVQMKFISLVQVKEMPAKPDENSGKTYVRAIEELRRKIREEVTGVTVRSSGKGQADLCLPDAFFADFIVYCLSVRDAGQFQNNAD